MHKSIDDDGVPVLNTGETHTRIRLSLEELQELVAALIVSECPNSRLKMKVTKAMAGLNPTPINATGVAKSVAASKDTKNTKNVEATINAIMNKLVTSEAITAEEKEFYFNNTGIEL